MLFWKGSEEVVIVYILIEMGLLKSEHRRRVVKAQNGLRQAPKAWAVHRDKLLTSFEFFSGGNSFVLKQSIADESRWYVLKKRDSDVDCQPCWLCMSTMSLVCVRMVSLRRSSRRLDGSGHCRNPSGLSRRSR